MCFAVVRSCPESNSRDCIIAREGCHRQAACLVWLTLCGGRFGSIYLLPIVTRYPCQKLLRESCLAELHILAFVRRKTLRLCRKSIILRRGFTSALFHKKILAKVKLWRSQHGGQKKDLGYQRSPYLWSHPYVVRALARQVVVGA